MPEITMCEGGECPLKEKCYRYTSNPIKEKQTYFRKPPFEILHGKFSCSMFWGEASDLLFETLTGIFKTEHGRGKENRKKRNKNKN